MTTTTIGTLTQTSIEITTDSTLFAATSRGVAMVAPFGSVVLTPKVPPPPNFDAGGCWLEVPADILTEVIAELAMNRKGSAEVSSWLITFTHGASGQPQRAYIEVGHESLSAADDSLVHFAISRAALGPRLLLRLNGKGVQWSPGERATVGQHTTMNQTQATLLANALG